MTKISLGRKGEQIAEKFLGEKGFKILERNFHCRFGEIDLIAKDKDTLVFIEVKSRSSVKFGLPEEAVTTWKVKTIAKVGEYYRFLHQGLPEAERIDVVVIEFNEEGILNRVELIDNVTG